VHSAFHVQLGFPMFVILFKSERWQDILFYSLGEAWSVRLEMCMALSVGNAIFLV